MTKAVPRLPDPSRPANAPVFQTDGKRLVLDRVLDDWGCKARDLGRVLDYAAEGRKLVDKIGGAWKDEFAEGVDFLRGSEGITESVTPVQAHEIILTRSGINLVCILTRKPLGRQIRHWLARDVMTQIADTGTYSTQPTPTLVTREADLSALTETVSALVPMLTAITTTLTALASRVESLEASSTTSTPPRPLPRPSAGLSAGEALEALRTSGLVGIPSHGNSKVRYVAFDPTDVERVTGSRSVLSEWAARGWLVGEGPAHLTRKVMVMGVRKRMVCIRRDIFETPPALHAPRRVTGPFDRPALPAPRLVDGIHVFGPTWARTSERGKVQGLEARVRVKDGAPVEVYAPRTIPDGAYLKDTERAFAQAFPGYRLVSDWRSRGGWPNGYEPPADAGLTAQVYRATQARPVGRVINDENFNAVALEFRGAKADLPAISAEAARLRYRVGPWRQERGAWRADVLH